MGSRDDLFWAEFLGIEPSDWNIAGVAIRAHVGLAGYCGLWCFRRNDRIVISAPPGWVARCGSLLGHLTPEQLMDQDTLRQTLGPDFKRSIGASFQGCLEPADFVLICDTKVRPIQARDDDAVNRFRAECSSADWDDSGLDEVRAHMAAYFEGSRITALAGYRPWSQDAGDPCILTHPEFRGRGHGTAVVSAVVRQAIDEGKLLLFQTLESNTAAVSVAFRLGYRRYANHMAVRLTADSPSNASLGLN